MRQVTFREAICQVILQASFVAGKVTRMNRPGVPEPQSSDRGDVLDRIVQQWSHELPELDTQAMATIGRLQRAARYVDARVERELARFGLNLSEFNILAALRRSGAPYRLAPAELSRTLLLTSGGLTKRIDRLQAAGIVSRAPDPDDGRGVLVALTDSGHALFRDALSAHLENEDNTLAALDREERAQLAELLRRLLVSFGDGVHSRRDRAYRIERRIQEHRRDTSGPTSRLP